MCRYSYHNYKDHFACFDCRKAFKYWQWEECGEKDFDQKQKLTHVPREILCPDCSKPMIDMGLDFKAPKKSDTTAWAILESLADNGFTFHSCGCGPGFIPPKTLSEVPQWLEKNRSKNEGQRLLDRINNRS